LRILRKLPLQATNLHRDRAVVSDSQLFTHLLKRHALHQALVPAAGDNGWA
jgi:hypothetical protein